MGYKYNITEYKILPVEVIRKIHEISLDVLENIGFQVPNVKIINLLYQSGAKIDKKNNIVKVSADLVEKSIKNAGKKHILYGRNKENKAEFGYDMFNFNGSSGQFAIINKDGVRKPPTTKDLDDAIKIGEKLSFINITGAMVIPADIPQNVVDVYTFYKLLSTTSKPFTAWIFNGKSARVIIEMMQIVAGSKEELQQYPFYETFIEPVSPLSYRADSLDILVEFANAGLPVGFSPMVQVGATGPCSVIGTIIQENAEILSGIVMAQVLKEGLPISYGGIAHVFDMRNQTIAFGSAEQTIMSAALIQLGRYYGFPVYSNTGLTDSNIIDAQYGIEASATLSFGSLSRSDIFGHLGICGEDSAASLLKLIIDNELAGYFIRILSGFSYIDFDDIFKEIKNAGIGGNYLPSPMTLKNFKNEIWYSELFIRLPWGSWINNGEKNITETAALKMSKLLNEDMENDALEKSIFKELKKILKFYDLKV